MHQEVVSLFDEGLCKELIPKNLADDLFWISNDQNIDDLLILKTHRDIIRNSCHYFLLNLSIVVADDPCYFGADHSITEYLILYI